MKAQNAMIANLRHAARNGGASISGGEFTPAECRAAAEVLELAPYLVMVLQDLMRHPHIAGYLPYAPNDQVMLAARDAIVEATGIAE